MCGVVPQGLDERLIGPDVLLVGAPAEDDAASAVYLGRETRCEPGLADARLPGQDDETRAAAPAFVQPPERRAAADEWSLVGASECYRQRHLARRACRGFAPF